ncbi:ABC transporter substrate-binding protein [Streptomyces sp. NBC_01433]|uniref:ABC transporter substrate-binding protein n=1 Tax=Streptomyces sp. NBC_01433 TaxID=2903864 RepID=UPI002251B111|nr:ABC transporter substrate-binding protein [Streptomyces sp. NBC_01433]MCX4679522.1 ABC transporter substrate-binding protein [Streptomyces sp. NBC_01433]
MPSSAGKGTRRTPKRGVRPVTAVAAAFGLVATAAACGGGSAGGSGGSRVVVAIAADPGSLSPTTALASTALAMNSFAYDTLVHIAADGSLIPGVAEKWTVTSTSARFTIRSGVSCEDGSALTATDVAAEYNHIADPANQSPMLGFSVPVGAVAKADEATRTVTVTTKRPAPFIAHMARLLPLLCEESLAAPAALAKATGASGPYRLTEAVPGDHYTYARRDGYSWGPGGATGADLPRTVVFKVVANESTAANLLMAGQIDVAQINGGDRQRLDAAKVKNRSVEGLFGQLLFNQAAGRPPADLAVRRALISVLDLKDLRNVSTGGDGTPPTSIGEVAPTPCTGDPVAGNLPAHDPERAAATLTAAGWTKSGGTWTKDGKPLTIGFSYATNLGSQVASAVELAVQKWTSFGVKASAAPVGGASIAGTLAGGDWDVAWAPIGVTLPDQLTQFYDGPPPPKGNNFGAVANPDYHRLAARASAMPGTSGCALWEEAGAALVKRLDIVPIVSRPMRHYAKGVTFQVDGGGIIPSTLRRSAG